MNPAGAASLDPAHYRDLVRRALDEDRAGEDVTTRAIVASDLEAHAVILAKSALVVAGLEVAFEAFRQLDPDVRCTVRCADGSRCGPGTVIAEIQGLAGALIAAERTALNFLQRLSGTATLTRRCVDAVGGRMRVLDTRKTTPLLRCLEKYAVRAGGGVNHRFHLADGVLIKDNHIRLAGGVAPAVAAVRRAVSGVEVEVEAQNLDQVDQALAAGADIVLLDNLSIGEVAEAVRRCRGRARTEVSGGVTLDRLAELASTGADSVSLGALTHSAPAADISLEIETRGRRASDP